MKIIDGLIAEARQVASPNYDERPSDEVSLIVIHCISLPAGHFGTGYVESFFQNKLDCSEHSDFEDIRKVSVSSHLFIRRSGELIQFVPLHRRAWHAGESTFRGRSHCNDFSIGVELEGIDSDEFTDVQYNTLSAVIRAIRQVWPIVILPQDESRILAPALIGPKFAIWQG